jgi:hypothetical protein
MFSIRIINDWHLRGVSPYGSFEELTSAILLSKYRVALNGDIWDFANCPFKELPELYQQMILTLKHIGMVNGLVIRGNHSLNQLNAPDLVLLENEQVLISHSDIESWGKDRSSKFRSQTAGAGWFKRNVISKTIDSMRHLLAVRPNIVFSRTRTHLR